MNDYQIKTRKVKQQYKSYSEEFKMNVVRQVIRRKGMKKIEVLRRNGVENYSLYYKWENKYRDEVMKSTEIVPMTMKMNGLPNVINVTEIKLTVNLTNINEVIEMFENLKQVVGVKSVTV